METAGTPEDCGGVTMETKMEVQPSHLTSLPEQEPAKPTVPQPRRRPLGRRSQRGKRRGVAEKRRGMSEKRRSQKQKRRCQEEKKEGVTVKRIWSGGKRRWDKKHYCVFCRRPQVKIARHLLRKHADEQEVMAASALPTGSKQRHLLLEHLRCRGNYMHNIEVIRQGSGEIVPWRQPSEEVDARNYLPCPLCLGFFLRADLWKHQVCCRKKLAIDPASKAEPSSEADPASKAETAPDIAIASSDSSASRTTEDHNQNSDTSLDHSQTSDTGLDHNQTSDTGLDHNQTSDNGLDQNQTSNTGLDHTQTHDSAVIRPRKRTRVQAAASRLLPISSGASESCSEILHRMNQDNVSYQVKSDWLICKYGNKLMGNQDSSQRRYDYVSQKLRELGRLLLAAKSLESDVQTLQDLLAPGRLSLVLSAARKAAGYRWSRPPLAVKTTLKTVCEIAIAENLQEGDWEAAARTTDFYHMLGRDWDNLGLQNPCPDPETDPAAPEEGPRLKKPLVQSTNQDLLQSTNQDPVQSKNQDLIQSRNQDLIQDVLSKNGDRPVGSVVPPESRLQTPVPGFSSPAVPRKVRRRPWSTAEKEAIWRQLGVHVLVQSVPGKEVCQRCLDLEPVLKGRHWKDIKNQVHNQIQSQKKQQFHAQMDLEENQDHRDQVQDQRKQQLHQYQTQMDQQAQDRLQNQKKQLYQTQIDQQAKNHSQNQKKQLYQPQMDQQVQDSLQNQKRTQYQLQMNHQAQESLQNQKKQLELDQLDHQDHLNIHKKQLCHPRLDHQDHQDQSQTHKKQLYQLDQQNQSLQSLDRDSSLLTGSAYGPDRSLRASGHLLLEREPAIAPYPLLHRVPGPHMDQLLTRNEWTEEVLVQNYPINRPLGRNLLLDVPPVPPPDPHSGHVHF